MLKRGIRINAICPGPTDTPLAQANAEMWLTFGSDYRADVGIEASTPLEQAYPLVFLCSTAGASINGITLISDAGYMSSGLPGSFPDAPPVAQFLMARFLSCSPSTRSSRPSPSPPTVPTAHAPTPK